MNQKITLHSKRCWIAGTLQEASIFVEDGVIVHLQIGPRDLAIKNLVDVGEDVIMPGCIDAHVHINEPGRTSWEGFETATKAAAAGGITSIVDMPLNSSPVTTSPAAFQQKLDASEGKLYVNCGFYGGLVPGNHQELATLFDMGVLGVKSFLVHSGIDEFPEVQAEDLELALPIIRKYQRPFLAHCELADDTPIHDLASNPSSYTEYVKSRPKSWENSAINWMIDLCKKHQAHIHIVHLASSESLNAITQAKKEGLPLSVETCPHYIFFDAEEIPDAQTIYKCAPPIREKENNEVLRKGLAQGLIDFLASDHSPAPPALKEIESGNLQKAWGGIAGLQFLLSSSWTALRKHMSLEQFIPLLTSKPAEFLGISERKGSLEIGHDADLVIWSPESTFRVEAEKIQHRHKISPYLGLTLYGKVKQTFVQGNSVFENDTLNYSFTRKAAGTWLLKKK